MRAKQQFTQTKSTVIDRAQLPFTAHGGRLRVSGVAMRSY